MRSGYDTFGKSEINLLFQLEKSIISLPIAIRGIMFPAIN
jgi:hypothetical protein